MPAQAGDAVRVPAPLELVEARQLLGLGGDDHLAAALGADPALVAVVVELARALDAEPRLQRSRAVVDPGVDHAAGMAGLVGRDPLLALEHRDRCASGVAQRQLARGGEADDPGADDGDVALARRTGRRGLGGSHRAPV